MNSAELPPLGTASAGAGAFCLASGFFEAHRPILTARCSRQSGDTFTARPPHCEHTNRRRGAIEGNGTSSASPSASKLNDVACMHAALAQTTKTMAQTTCESKAVGKDGKPLSGACEGNAVDKNGKPLAGAAKASFLKKCEGKA